MKKLKPKQVEAVIEWLNTWEQLKNTAIPMRFKEEFGKPKDHKPETIKKPPLGIIPSHLWREERKAELHQAISRLDGVEELKYHKDWIRELCELHLLKDGMVNLLRNCVSESCSPSFSETQKQFDKFLIRKGLEEKPQSTHEKLFTLYMKEFYPDVPL